MPGPFSLCRDAAGTAGSPLGHRDDTFCGLQPPVVSTPRGRPPRSRHHPQGPRFRPRGSDGLRAEACRLVAAGMSQECLRLRSLDSAPASTWEFHLMRGNGGFHRTALWRQVSPRGVHPRLPQNRSMSAATSASMGRSQNGRQASPTPKRLAANVRDRAKWEKLCAPFWGGPRMGAGRE